MCTHASPGAVESSDSGCGPLELPESEWHRVIATSLTSVFLVTKYVAMRMVEDFLVRHMKPERDGIAVRTAAEARKGKSEERALFIDPPINEAIWARGIEKPPSRIRVRALKFEDGSVVVHLAE